MTVRECIDRVDANKPNQYTEEDKVRWISEVEHSIYTDIILTHRIPKKVSYSPYTVDDMDKELIATFPYDNIYPAFVEMKIDEANKETDRYNASVVLFNAYYDDYAKHINKLFMPRGRNAYHIY